MADIILETEVPKRKSPMEDPAVRAKAAATRERHKQEKLAAEAQRQENKVKREERAERKEEKQEVKQQSAAGKARWASEKATEEDVRRFFARELEVEEGLQLLARMRKNCEIASYALNQRITESAEKERCKTCKGPKKQNKDWILRRPHRDPTTQLIVTDVFCSMACVAMENQKSQGVKGVSDRGMLSSDNERVKPPV